LVNLLGVLLLGVARLFKSFFLKSCELEKLMRPAAVWNLALIGVVMLPEAKHLKRCATFERKARPKAKANHNFPASKK